MTFKRVNSYSTDKPARLDRELVQLEDNIAAAFVAARGEAVPRPRVESFLATPTRNIVAILPGQQLSIDTSLAAANVVFPALDPRNFGALFILIKRNAVGGNVRTSCQDPAVLCNAAAFPTLAASGAVVFFCDATGYFRQ